MQDGEEVTSFDLMDFTDRAELTQIVKSFCQVTGLAGGIVSMPRPGSAPPTDPSQLRELRLTDPEVINPTEFCTIVRACKQGNMRCHTSDQENAKTANEQGKALSYPCHMKLFDLMAPIRVCGRHVANVYLGQVRRSQSDFEYVREHYEKLIVESGPDVERRATEQELKEAFGRLPVADARQLKNYEFFVEMLANLISQRANRQAVVKRAVEAAREVGISLDLKFGLDTYVRYAMELMGADTGSIFLFDPNDDEKLVPYALKWGKPSQLEFKFALHGAGIVAEVARVNLAILHERAAHPHRDRKQDRPLAVSRFRNRKELDDHAPEQMPGTRKTRDLESLMICPICCGDEMLGTLDVGSKHIDAFTSDDEHVLKLFASVIGAHVWNVRQRSRLVELFGKRDAYELMQALVKEIPRDLNGLGCSIFVVNGKGNAELAATTEFISDVNFSEVVYEPGQGLTGGVLKHHIPIRVRRGPQCRTTKIDDRLRRLGISWSGKYAAHVGQLPRDYYENRPFLAMPVNTPEGAMAGIIRIPDSREDFDFTDESERMLKMYADFLGHFLKPPQHRAGSSSMTETPKIFLAHGTNNDAALNVRTMLQQLGCEVKRYKEEALPGYAFEIVLSMIRQCDAAVILCSGDDELKDGKRVIRRNVAHELGMCQALLGPQKTIILLEEGVEMLSNVGGIQHVSFQSKNVSNCLDNLTQYLKRIGALPSLRAQP